MVLALGASLCWGIANFFGGLMSRSRALLVVLLCTQTAAVTLLATIIVLSDTRFPGAAGLAAAAAAGVTGLIGIASLYRGMAIGTVSIIAPVAATGSAVPVIFGLATGERPGALQMAGIAVALTGVVLASRRQVADGPGRRVGASVGFGLAAALGFGFVFVGLDHAIETAGVTWTVLTARAVQLTLLVAIALALRPPLPPSPRALLPLLAIGVVDVTATLQFSLATTHGLLSIVAVVGSLFPAVSVLLARVILDERLSRVQGAGVLATLAGTAAISAG